VRTGVGAREALDELSSRMVEMRRLVSIIIIIFFKVFFIFKSEDK